MIVVFPRGWFVWLLTLVAFVFSTSSAWAVGYQIVQITDNDVNDSGARISGTNVTWFSSDGNDNEIYFYDGNSITQITDNSGNDRYPEISGDNVVWREGYNVYLYDGTTTSLLSGNNRDGWGHQISGDNVVWNEEFNDDAETYFYNGTSTTRMTNNDYRDIGVVVSGDYAAWQGANGGNYDIFMYDGSTTTNITDDTTAYQDLAISGDNLALVGRFGIGSSDDEIVYYDGTSLIQLTDDDFRDAAPQISGNNIAWEKWDGTDYEIYLYDGTTTAKLSDNSGFDRDVRISSDIVAWETNAGGPYEIVVYDGNETTHLSASQQDLDVEVSGKNLVWRGWDGNDWEIFMATPIEGCVIGDADCDGDVDVDDILPAFTNFTGPGSFGKTRAEGDVHGDGSGATTTLDPHDGDVDIDDLLTMFGAFTASPDEAGGLAPAAAGDPAIPDLVYDATTGEVVFDLDGAAGLIGYSLKSAGGFLPGAHTPILGGVTTSLTTELAEAALSTPGLPASIGFVFPLGMDLAALTAFLTDNTVSTGLGAPLVPFDLVVVGEVVPEPATVVMAVMGLFGLGLAARRRGRWL